MADVMAFGITSLLIAYRGVIPPRSTPSVRLTELDLRAFSMLIPFILGLVSFIVPPSAVEYEGDLTQHPLAAGDPDFTWCYKPNMGSPCVHTTTPPDQCVSFTGNTPDNDKARSVTTDANSRCTLYQHVQCQGKSLEIAPATTIDNLGAYGFDKEMSSYRCKWAAKQVPTEVTCNIMVKNINGTEFGYISPVFTGGGYDAFQSVQRGALSVAFSYLPDARTRFNLRTLNGLGAAPDSTFPFLGGSNERLRLERYSYTCV
ncbi:hypothetical protein B0H19DRAFT_1256343 [Mycena capillaripes]|nr:hypothetical protein B0H19DRAFT_1256343 [Mycena capillaripes]